MLNFTNVSWKLLVKIYCDKYVKNKKAAEDWATSNIPKEWFPTLRPLVKATLAKRGIHIGENK